GRHPIRGEGIVQTTNPKGAAKAVVGCITGWFQVRILVGPPKKKSEAGGQRSDSKEFVNEFPKFLGLVRLQTLDL
ncbi:MAG: hypothetical protein AB1327_06475, partial [Bacillota bacterium]